MNTHTKSCLVIAILASGILLFVLWLSPLARAAGPWFVTPNGNDGNDCLSAVTPCVTLTGALGKATSGDTIYVAIGTYTSTGSEVVLIDKDLTLSGGWDAAFTTQDGMSTIDAQDARRGIWVNNVVSATVTTATIEYFVIQNGSSAEAGSGIFTNGIVTVTNSIVSGNHGFYGGAIVNGGTLTLNNSTVRDNTSQAYGGGIYNSGTLTLNNSTVSNNAIYPACAGYFRHPYTFTTKSHGAHWMYSAAAFDLSIVLLFGLTEFSSRYSRF